MKKEYHRWHSSRLGREMGIVVYGHCACDIHLATGSGPWEDSSEPYRLSEILARKGIPHHLDDLGAAGRHAKDAIFGVFQQSQILSTRPPNSGASEFSALFVLSEVVSFLQIRHDGA